MIRCFAALILAAAGIGASAPDTLALTQSDLKNACRADYLKHCAGVLPGGGRILNCLAAKKPELSPDCGRAVALGQACREDFSRFCPDAQAAGDGSALACLQKNAEQLSAECRASLSGSAGR